jgi:16S rRNA processing protein RimM
MSAPAPDDVVPMGRVVGLFGVKGWVKVYSSTRPRAAILNYRSWRLKLTGAWQKFELAEGRMQGPGVVARFEGIEDRDAASHLVGADIAVERAQLPTLKPGEYYWAELEGLKVVNLEGVELGTVSHLIETGANDVMVVIGERERLVPYTTQAIREVDLKHGVVRVDWDAEF